MISIVTKCKIWILQEIPNYQQHSWYKILYIFWQSYTGGGSGGSLFAETTTFTGTGNIYARGAAGMNANHNNEGGGGAGGYIVVHYTSGNFKSGNTHIQGLYAQHSLYKYGCHCLQQ